MSENKGPRITLAVLSAMTAGLRAEALRAKTRGDIPLSVYRAVIAEIDDLDVLKRRGRAPEDPELFRAWIERRHQSLPESREKKAVEAMLRRLASLAEMYCIGFRDGAREATGEQKPRLLAAEIAS